MTKTVTSQFNPEEGPGSMLFFLSGRGVPKVQAFLGLEPRPDDFSWLRVAQNFTDFYTEGWF